MSTRFRKKPVEVDAELHTGDRETAQRLVNWSGGRCKRKPHNGPCKPDIFAETYEPVAEFSGLPGGDA